ncbi:MAG: pantoate--beta-alanine ligase [Armatimonadetes bacterium]|nr:pantoate--beta-alanine ligase [Armatimonadota bacterium]
MQVITSVAEMQHYARTLQRQRLRIGFVPTMGFLHDGHLSLIRLARTEADIVGASIFVNPTQFAPTEDLAQYPRDFEGDKAKVASVGCDFIFYPTTQEMYPAGASTIVNVEGITSRYEGAFRPTHFRGVTTIVAKLFNSVMPDVAVFGQKDAQQVAVVQKMMKDLQFPIRLLVGQTLREPDGLAMSSRNVYLSPEDRTHGLSISAALRAAQQVAAHGGTLGQVEQAMHSQLSPAIALDYADVVDPETFDHPTEESTQWLGIIAGTIGRTRLIDNMLLRSMGH